MQLTWLDYAMIAVPITAVFIVSLLMRQYLRSVADFLAASRCAGRYLLATAGAELGAGIVATVMALETFSKSGFSLGLWGGFAGFIGFIMMLNGVIGFRFRETRSLTFHQFFEARYSRGIRGLAAFMNFFSGIINFGLQPMVGAQFCVHFCGLPISTHLGAVHVPTYALVMVLLLGVSLFMSLTGGQISVMVTDCLEGLISSLFYLVVAVAILCVLSYSQMEKGMLSAAKGQSFVNPFDISGRRDFNGWYVGVALALSLYYYRGNAWQAGFAAAARNAHEGKMAGILGTWRGMGSVAMIALVSVGAMTVLHNPDFAPTNAVVQQRLDQLPKDDPHLRTQMEMPVALSVLLPVGVKGAFCAIGLFGMLAGFGGQMHAYGSAFVQDVVVPFRRRPMTPKQQIRWLRGALTGIAIFVVVFGLSFKLPDYLVLFTQLVGSLYLCVGAVVWGGLYWKKGTTAGAWASLIVGVTLASIGLLAMVFWKAWFQAMLLAISSHAGWASFTYYFSAHPNECPINSQVLALISYVGAGSMYVIVSLLTCREDFNMDRLLHRGQYRVPELASRGEKVPPPRAWAARAIGIDANYTRGDKAIAISVFGWGLLWQLAAIVILIWNLAFYRWSDKAWFHWAFFQNIWVVLVLAVITTIWFTIGGTRDIFALFATLKTLKRDDTDDGTVHHDKDEPAAAELAVADSK